MFTALQLIRQSKNIFSSANSDKDNHTCSLKHTLRLRSLVYNPLPASTVISHCSMSLPLYCVTSVPVVILFQEERNAFSCRDTIAVATQKDNGCRSIYSVKLYSLTFGQTDDGTSFEGVIIFRLLLYKQ